MRSVPVTLLLFALPACGVFGGLSGEEHGKLIEYQNRAQEYWGAGSLEQALYQAQRGLAIDTQDYKLRWIQASYYLQRSRNNERLLDRASPLFEDLYSARGASSHLPNFLLNYAQYHEQVGLREQRHAEQLERAAGQRGNRDVEADVLRARALEHRRLARHHFDTAKRNLQVLVVKGEQLANAHYELMLVEAQLRAPDRAVGHGQLFLDEITKEQELFRTLIAAIDPVDPLGAEQRARQSLYISKEREKTARVWLAQFHFDHKQYREAVSHLARILELAPHEAVHYYNRADALMRLGRLSDAEADYLQFLRKTDLPEGNLKVRDAHRVINKKRS